jgi:hypothetical protein
MRDVFSLEHRVSNADVTRSYGHRQPLDSHAFGFDEPVDVRIPEALHVGHRIAHRRADSVCVSVRRDPDCKCISECRADSLRFSIHDVDRDDPLHLSDT